MPNPELRSLGKDGSASPVSYYSCERLSSNRESFRIMTYPQLSLKTPCNKKYRWDNIFMQSLFNDFDMSKFEVQKRIQYEYQNIGLEMQEYFPKKEWKQIWALFWKHDPKKVEQAFSICKKNGIYSVRYLIGVIKRI